MTGTLLRLPRVQIALKGLLLFGLGIFLLTRITSGALNFYISQRFGWLTMAAVLGLFLVGGSYRYLFRDAGHTHAGEDDQDHASQHDQHHVHAFGLGRASINLAADHTGPARAAPASGRGGPAKS